MENVLTLIGLLLLGGFIITVVTALFIVMLMKATDQND